MNEEKQGIRINKALAQAGFCSRRRADELVAAGRVLLNGAAVRELGVMVRAGDELSVDGKSVTVRAPRQEDFVYLMLNKPVQVVSTARDPQGRQTVLDLLPPEYSSKRLFPVGRLDYFSEGLLILANDGELARRLTHPAFHLPKHYEILLREDVPEAALLAMRSGLTLAEGEKLAPVEVKVLGKTGRGTRLAMTLRQGVNRQIRRMCRDLGLTVLRLARIGQGRLKLGGLPPGKCRSLTAEEIAQLKQDVGMGQQTCRR